MKTSFTDIECNTLRKELIQLAHQMQGHHFARLAMMMAEERGEDLSYEEALGLEYAEVVEVRDQDLLVRMGEDLMPVAKYEDENGVYFLNQQLEKQYVTEKEEVEEFEPTTNPSSFDNFDSAQMYANVSAKLNPSSNYVHEVKVHDWGKEYIVHEIKEVEREETYRFEVVYEHNGRTEGFAIGTTEVSAKNVSDAVSKARKNFKNIYEINVI